MSTGLSQVVDRLVESLLFQQACCANDKLQQLSLILTDLLQRNEIDKLVQLVVVVVLIQFICFTNAKISLRKMLRKSDGFTGDNISADDFNGIYEHICLEPSKVVLIFDGLDELTVDDETLTREECVNNNNEETHIFHIWKQLVRGELLPGATILTTSRPTAEKLYKPTIYDPIQYEREVEILGFHEKEVKSYVERFCGIDTQKSTAIWNLIKASPELLSCNVPKTITELYKKAVNILLLRHNLEYKGKQIPPEKLDDLN